MTTALNHVRKSPGVATRGTEKKLYENSFQLPGMDSAKLYLSPVMKDNFEYNLSIILMNQYSGTNSGASRTWRNMLVKCTQTVSSQADDFLRIAQNQFEEERWRCRRLFGLRLLPPICCRGCMTMLSESSRRRKFSWNKWPQILSNIK